MNRANKKQKWMMVAAAVALLSASAGANATPMHFMANFTPLNDSGVSGMASLSLDGNMLTAHITATGLEPNALHVQHIHGLFDASGNPANSTTPTLQQDANGDGIIELGEGATTYGAILLPLTPFPMAADGTIDYTETFDLTDSTIFGAGFDKSDLMPLTFREIVLHGRTATQDLTDAGVSYAQGEYVPTLPVASGEIVAATAVPEPASFGMMLGGLGLLSGLMWLRRRGNT